MGIDGYLKTTKIEFSKYCIWTVRQNLQAKLTSWGSSFNLLWKSVFFLKFNWCGSTTEDCLLYNRRCCSNASENQRTVHAVLKFLVCFFLSILFQNEEKPLKKDLFGLSVGSSGFFKQLVWDISKKLTNKNNKKPNFETLYLKFHAEFSDKSEIVRNFIQFSSKQNGSLQTSPTYIHIRELSMKELMTPWYNFGFAFFCLFCLKMSREFWKMFFLHFWNKAMPLFKPFCTGIGI